MTPDAPRLDMSEPRGDGIVISGARHVRPFGVGASLRISRGAVGHGCSGASEGRKAPAEAHRTNAPLHSSHAQKAARRTARRLDGAAFGQLELAQEVSGDLGV